MTERVLAVMVQLLVSTGHSQCLGPRQVRGRRTSHTVNDSDESRTCLVCMRLFQVHVAVAGSDLLKSSRNPRHKRQVACILKCILKCTVSAVSIVV